MHVFLEYMTLFEHLYTKTIVMDIVIYYRNYRFFFYWSRTRGLVTIKKIKTEWKGPLVKFTRDIIK